ncbi:MAG: sulfoxide reductase heme-binding subunit YedZ [Gammaproteobacteria bacterium]|jgi:methionine sulfoxide reductase heme-binding subunit|nr:sulfoxide reductase heme-binding subunit YedZ [Gammaproteobacteria bacterium]MBT4493340.1 sulfoxide reductase heme-binding subunit YedZ [Gammaproteobacteria bacterium]MBT7371132.1 sulfoxide reductase heme-binding subunit YedZ [Gammaproteobacteria bacterium]
MLKPFTFLLSVAPVSWSVYQIWLLQSGASHHLGADPGKELVLIQGEWTIRFLILTLLVTPFRTLSGWRWPLRIRRMLGLFTFFYASLHLSAYCIFLLELDPGRLGGELAKRPFIGAGFIAWLLLASLAATSTKGMVRQLGRRWKQLHRAVYVVALLAVLHVFWLVKSSYLEAIVYGGAILLLLCFRLFDGKHRIFHSALKAQV